MIPIHIDTTASYISYSTRIITITTKIAYVPATPWDNYLDIRPDWIKSLLHNVYFFTKNRELNMEEFGKI